MTDPLDGMLDDDIDELLDGTTGTSLESEETSSTVEAATGPERDTSDRQEGLSSGPDGDEAAVQDGADEVRIAPAPVDDVRDDDEPQYDVLLDHDEGRAVLVEPGATYESDRYQLLGEVSEMEEEGYDEPAGVEPVYPSTLAQAGASMTAGTISAGFMTAEAGLEAFYNGLCGLVSLMD